MRSITVAMTGASGAPYTLRLMQEIVKAGHHLQFVCSQPGQIVIAMESELKLKASPQAMHKQLCEYLACDADQLSVYATEQWTAPIASGSSAPDAMVVCPCSMGTLAAIAQGLSNNLIHRAADVVIKERRKLILVPRETPFSSIHLQNMLRLSDLGVVILPPSPGFYQGVESLDDLIDFVVARILDQLDIDNQLSPRWAQQEDA